MPWAAFPLLPGSGGIHASGRDQSPNFNPDTGRTGRPKWAAKEEACVLQKSEGLQGQGSGAWGVEGQPWAIGCLGLV